MAVLPQDPHSIASRASKEGAIHAKDLFGGTSDPAEVPDEVLDAFAVPPFLPDIHRPETEEERRAWARGAAASLPDYTPATVRSAYEQAYYAHAANCFRRKQDFVAGQLKVPPIKVIQDTGFHRGRCWGRAYKSPFNQEDRVAARGLQARRPTRRVGTKPIYFEAF